MSGRTPYDVIPSFLWQVSKGVRLICVPCILKPGRGGTQLCKMRANAFPACFLSIYVKRADSRFSAEGRRAALRLLHHGAIYGHIAEDQVRITTQLGARTSAKTLFFKEGSIGGCSPDVPRGPRVLSAPHKGCLKALPIPSAPVKSVPSCSPVSK